MKLRRDVLIAVLATFCLTSSLFAVKPSGSQTERQYDPWADLNDDGKISMDEIVRMCELFGTTGDPTKNVNVTNFPQIYRIMHTTYTYAETFHAKSVLPVWRYFETEGYRQITIAISIDGNASVTISWAIPNGGCWDQYRYSVISSYNFTVVTYQVIAPEIYIEFCSFLEVKDNNIIKFYPLNATITLGIYMTT
jgi:hypothetical protein